MNKHLVVATYLTFSLNIVSAAAPQPGTPEFFAQTNAAKNAPQPTATKSVEEALSQKVVPLQSPRAKKVHYGKIYESAYIKKFYAANEIVIKLTGIKTDAFSVSSSPGQKATLNVILVENSYRSFAEIVIAQKGIYPTKTDGSVDLYEIEFSFEPEIASRIVTKESIIGTLGDLENVRVNYSEEDQELIIIIPFHFARKIIPVTVE